MEAEALALDLARKIRDVAAPLLGRPDARAVAGTAVGGDPTYAIDELAELATEEALRDLDDVAYFTEDAGLVVRGRPSELLLVDPIDGSRPATAGFESCCVTVAVAPFRDGVTLGDVTYGCIVELPTGAAFQARKGSGAASELRPLIPSTKYSLDGLFWAGGFRGQPAVPLAAVLAGVFDVPGARGAFFDHGSSAYSLSRVATGQIDAYVDPGQRIVDEVPGLEEAFRTVGGGHVLNTTTYDAAAGVLVLREMGLPVTDARGTPLDSVPLLRGGTTATGVSVVAAATPELHAAILAALDEGFARLRRLLEAGGEDALLGTRG